MSELLENRRIFLVEDHAGNMAVMKTLLEFNGAAVRFNRWGTDFKADLTSFAPLDIILLDLMVSDQITGYDIFTQIRALPGYGDIPIVAVSASDPSLAIPRTRSMGFSGFIQKPINVDRFPQQIADILAGQVIWDTGALYTRRR